MPCPTLILNIFRIQKLCTGFEMRCKNLILLVTYLWWHQLVLSCGDSFYPSNHSCNRHNSHLYILTNKHNALLANPAFACQRRTLSRRSNASAWRRRRIVDDVRTYFMTSNTYSYIPSLSLETAKIN